MIRINEVKLATELAAALVESCYESRNEKFTVEDLDEIRYAIEAQETYDELYDEIYTLIMENKEDD